MESPSVWKQLRRHLAWLDGIDVLLYGGLGLALLGYAIYSVAAALHEAGRLLALAAFVVAVALSVATVLRDLRRKQLTLLSKGLAGAWALCVALVIVIELIESFSWR